MHNLSLNKGKILGLLALAAILIFPFTSSAGQKSPTKQKEQAAAGEAEILSLTAGGYGHDKGMNNPGLAGKPVSLLSGAETFTRTDLTIGSVFPIRIVRRYHSKTTYDSPLGFGWAHNYDKRLYTYPDGSVVIRKETGWKRKFIRDSNIGTPPVAGVVALKSQSASASSALYYITPVGETGTLVKNTDGTFTYTEKDGTAELYDLQGRLETITDANGNSLALGYEAATRSPLTGLLPANVDQSTPLVVAYDYRLSMIAERNASGQATGVTVVFVYDGNGRLTSITDNLGRSVTYSHDNIGNLTTVTTPTLTATYGYTDSNNKHLLTTVNEGSGAYTNTYDTKGRVVKQTHGTGQIDITYNIPYQKATVTTAVKDASGTLLNTRTRVVEFDSLGQPAKVTDTFGNQTVYTRNDKTWITREEYWENTGTVTSLALVLKAANTYSYGNKGNMLTRTMAQGSDIEKTITMTYDPVFNHELTETMASVVNPAQNKVTTHTYDTKGNRLTTTETGLKGDGSAYSTTTTYEYDANGKLKKIDGPRTDVQDVTTITYDTSTGFMTSVTRPLSGTTTYSNFDGLGNPGTVTDANGNATTLTYDEAGRLLTVKAPGDTKAVQISYTTGGCASCGGASNKIRQVILPEGDILNIGYDTFGNLAKISDGLGNSVNYTYDSDGNRLREEIKDPDGALQKSLDYQYDALNRLVKTINPDTTYSQNGYDFLGNRTSVKDPKGNITSYRYDALNRLTSTIQPGEITTGFEYDTNSDMTKVTDGNGNATVYKYDDMGRLYQTISPDTGTTTYTYDPAGNMASKTDAKSVAIGYSYDAENRLTKIDFPSDTDIVYTYDNCVNGKGRLCGVVDQSGTTSYEYTKKGQIAKETRNIDGNNFVTQYVYDMNGNVKSVTYPSGRIIAYNYANFRIIGVLNNGTTIASNISYKPFGGISGLTYGNGLARTIGYDNQYRISGIQTGTLQNFTYGYDANGNITAITNNLDNSKNKTYSYDALNRLTGGTGPWGTLSWTYDSVGNRLTQVEGAGTSTYSYQTGSNRHTGVTGVNAETFGYDANGNTTTENAKTYTYNQNQRMIRAVGSQTGDYVYNANGQRAKKAVAGEITYFIYNQNGQLISEYAGDGSIKAEYVYLKDEPVTKIDANGVQYILSDHLGSPVMMTDATGAKVWEIEARPFGDAASVTGSASLNIRFPGQYFDAETELNYNYFRDFNPAIGRYVESDPIGMDGGINLYSYVQNNPINYIDPEGESLEAAVATWIGGDLSMPDPSDFVWPKWVVYGVALGGAAAIDYCLLKEHTKNPRPSNWNKHTDPRSGGPEKADPRRRKPTKRPPDYNKGPWPPKPIPPKPPK